MKTSLQALLSRGLRLTSACLVSALVARAQTFTPYADAYVRGGTYASTSFGLETVLFVKNSGADYTYRSYLLFDLMGITGNVTSAKLRLYSPGGAADVHTVAGTVDAGDTWTEESLNFGTVPADQTVLGSLTVGSTAGFYEVDITSRVQSELSSGNRILGLSIADASAGATKVEFWSRESANPPQLVLLCSPSAPGSAGATTVSNDTIDVTWVDNSDNESSFTIQRQTGGGAWATVGTVGAGATRFTNTGLASGTAYSYRVCASNGNGDSAWSNTTTATTPLTVVQAFTSVADTYVGSGTNAGNSYGTDTNMGVKLSGVNYTFLSFLRFDLTSVTAPVTRATLRLYAETSQAETSKIFQVAGDTWNESITYTTMPTIGAEFAAVSPHSSSGYYEADITSYVQTEMTGNKLVSLAIQDPTSGAERVDYQTKEGANPPRLVLNLAVSIPSAPTGLTATVLGNETIDLAWTDPNDDEAAYIIEAKEGSGGVYVEVGSVGANATSFTHNLLIANTTYYYRVKASNAAGISPWSTEASATTLPLPPNAPTSLTATVVSTSQINLAWTDAANNENSFFVDRRVNGSSTWTQIGTLGANATTFSSTGLAAGTTYEFRVMAANAGGESGWSNIAVATTSIASGNVTIPVDADTYVGTGVNASTNYDGETVMKVKKSGADYTHLAYLRFDLHNVTGTVSAATLRIYAQTTVAQTHDVKAAADASDNWNEVTLTYNTPAPAPGAVKGTISTGTTAGYKTVDLTAHVQAELGGNKMVSLVIEDQTSGADLVQYQTKDGPNPPQLVLTMNTATVPVAPGNLNASAVSVSQINLTWDNVANETGYSIDRKTGAGGLWAQITTRDANILTYNDTGLAAGTTYYYRVRAYNAAGNSAYSNESSARTKSATATNCLEQGYRPAPIFRFDNTIVWRPIRSGATYVAQGWMPDVESVAMSSYYVFGPQMIRMDPASSDPLRDMVVLWNGVGGGTSMFPRTIKFYDSQMPKTKPRAWTNGMQVYQPSNNTPDAAFTFLMPNGEDVESFVEFTWPVTSSAPDKIFFDWTADHGLAAARNGHPSTETGYRNVRNIVYGTGFPYDQTGTNVGRVSGSGSAASNMAGALVWEELDQNGVWRQYWSEKTSCGYKYMRHILHATASHDLNQNGGGDQANTYEAPATSSDSSWSGYSHTDGIRYGRLYALQFADETAFNTYTTGMTNDQKALAWGLWRFGIRFFDGKGNGDHVVTLRINGMQYNEIAPWFEGVSDRFLKMVKDLRWVNNATDAAHTYWTGPGTFPSEDNLWPALTPIPQFNFNPVP